MKTKTIVLLLCLGIMPVLMQAQSAFDKFEKNANIGSVNISKGMLGIVASMSADDVDEETQDFIDLAKSIEHIRVFVSENEQASAEMATTMKKYVKSSALDELMKVRDGDSNVYFYIKNGKDDSHVSELLMFVTGMEKKAKGQQFETVLMTMTGDIDLAKVGALVSKMNMHKGLKKVEKRG